MSKNINYENTSNFIIVFGCLIISIYFFYSILNLCNSGLDLTDEGYYLNWIANPYAYKASISQFGFLYNPIFIFLDENVANLRRANFLFSFLLSYCLIFFLIKPLIKSLTINFYYLQALLITFSIFVFLSMQIFTPSYNSLTLQGLLITCIGILFFENYGKKIGCFLISFGGWIVFMAKPSSAAILAIIILIYLITSKKSVVSILLCSVFALVLLILSSVVIDGSPILFIERILMGLDHLTLLNTNYDKSVKGLAKDLITITEKPELQNFNAVYYTVLSILLIFLFLCLMFYVNFKDSKYNHIFKIVLIFILITFFLLIQFNHTEWFYIFERYQRLQIFSVFVFSIFVILKSNHFNLIKTFNESYFRFIFIFLSLPYTYAFGSGVNILKKSLEAGIFYLLASFVILIPYYQKNRSISSVFAFLITGLIITSIHINWNIEHPYRQINSLKSNNFIFQLDKGRNYLRISNNQGEYATYVKNVAKNYGLVKDDYILDLTGKSPGLIFLLGANSLGGPWMMGGYPGSLEVAKAKINLIDCKKISKSWILHDKVSRNISLDLLYSYGSDIFLDYQEVGQWKAILYKGNFTQKLFRPVNSNTIYNKCTKIRNLNDNKI